MIKVNRGLSDLIWNNPHIDDMQKVQILPFVRGKEEIIAQLEERVRELENTLGTVKHTIARPIPYYERIVILKKLLDAKGE